MWPYYNCCEFQLSKLLNIYFLFRFFITHAFTILPWFFALSFICVLKIQSHEFLKVFKGEYL